MMAEKPLRIVEYDEAENVTATYVQSSSGVAGGETRVDVIVSEKAERVWDDEANECDSRPPMANRYGSKPSTSSFPWDTLTASQAITWSIRYM